MEIKKAWEFLPSPIPVLRPSHCPNSRISNAASPRQVIIYSTNRYTLLYSNSWDIIHPRRRLSLHYLCELFLSCEVREHRTITFVNAFPIGLALQSASLASGFHNVLTHPILGRISLSLANIRTNFESAK